MLNSMLKELFMAATPIACGNTWPTLQGDAQKRSCEDCNRLVYNLAEMTAAEFESLQQQAPERLCVVYEKQVSPFWLKAVSGLLPLLMLSQMAWADPEEKPVRKCVDYMYTPMMHPPDTQCRNDKGKTVTLKTGLDEAYKHQQKEAKKKKRTQAVRVKTP